MTQTIIPPTESHLGLFNTGSGKLIDIANPSADQICIKDIAHALSNICRFGGHAKPFYSVAQHCCLVTAMLPTDAKKYGLMHDATEAYLGDVIKPLKIVLGASYSQIEDRFEAVIIDRFQIHTSGEIKQKTKDADIKMLRYEHEALIMGNPARLASLLFDFNLDVMGWAWSPADAEQLFLATFEKLFGPEMMH
ncbi:MAG TPA: hypothetical protein VK173_11425 [Lacibacter sp.]|nr:hypothetical protein [Lacibacter sp.]